MADSGNLSAGGVVVGGAAVDASDAAMFTKLQALCNIPSMENVGLDACTNQSLRRAGGA